MRTFSRLTNDLSGQLPRARAEAETRTKAETEAGTEAETEAGTEAETEAGTEAETEAGTEAEQAEERSGSGRERSSAVRGSPTWKPEPSRPTALWGFIRSIGQTESSCAGRGPSSGPSRRDRRPQGPSGPPWSLENSGGWQQAGKVVRAVAKRAQMATDDDLGFLFTKIA